MSLASVPLGYPVHLDFTISSPASGFVESASTTPQFWVYDNDTDSPIVGPQNARPRTGYPGQYTVGFDLNTASGFVAHHFYNVVVSGNVESIQGQATLATIFTTNNFADTLSTTSGIWAYSPRTTTMESGDYAYYADIKFSKNSNSSKDEYTVDWFKNTQPVGSSAITAPTIQVFQRSNGASLIGASGMNYVSVNLGTLTYDELTNRTTAGDAYIAQAKATIDGATRTWNKLIGRDS